jgi:hypothetical protein
MTRLAHKTARTGAGDPDSFASAHAAGVLRLISIEWRARS